MAANSPSTYSVAPGQDFAHPELLSTLIDVIACANLTPRTQNPGEKWGSPIAAVLAATGLEFVSFEQVRQVLLDSPPDISIPLLNLSDQALKGDIIFQAIQIEPVFHDVIVSQHSDL